MMSAAATSSSAPCDRGRAGRRARSGGSPGSPRRGRGPAGPRPKTSSRFASSRARWRTASAETAEVRTLVSAIPSISATGASVVPSKTTTTPWTRGSPPIVTSFTARCPPTSDGIMISSPCSSPTNARGGSVSGSRPVVERRLERVDRDDRRQVALDVAGGEIGEVHSRLTVEYKPEYCAQWDAQRPPRLRPTAPHSRGGRRVGLATGLLVYALNGRRDEFSTAVSEASVVGADGDGGAARRSALLARSEAWHVTIEAAGGRVGAAGPVPRLEHAGASAAWSTAARRGRADRRAAPLERRAVPAGADADRRGVPDPRRRGRAGGGRPRSRWSGRSGLPWWSPLIAAAVIVAGGAGLRRLALCRGRELWRGLAVIRSLRGGGRVVGWVLVAVFAQIFRNWLLLHAVGVDASFFDAIAVLIAVVTLGQLPGRSGGRRRRRGADPRQRRRRGVGGRGRADDRDRHRGRARLHRLGRSGPAVGPFEAARCARGLSWLRRGERCV